MCSAIETGPFGAQQATFGRAHPIASEALRTSPARTNLYLDHGPKTAAFNVKVRWRMVIGI
jgi:hypothetical protein